MGSEAGNFLVLGMRMNDQVSQTRQSAYTEGVGVGCFVLIPCEKFIGKIEDTS